MNIFDKLVYSYNGSLPAANVIIKTDNSLISGYQTLSGSADIYFTKFGYTSIEATAAGFLMKDSNVNRNKNFF